MIFDSDNKSKEAVINLRQNGLEKNPSMIFEKTTLAHNLIRCSNKGVFPCHHIFQQKPDGYLIQTITIIVTSQQKSARGRPVYSRSNIEHSIDDSQLRICNALHHRHNTTKPHRHLSGECVSHRILKKNGFTCLGR